MYVSKEATVCYETPEADHNMRQTRIPAESCHLSEFARWRFY